MRLDRVRVEGFKSIREVDLTLSALNVMIGANGAGKSNLVGALSLLGELVEGRLQRAIARAGGASTLLHYGPKRTPALALEVESGLNRYRARLEHAPQDRLFFEDERAWGRRPDWARHFEVAMGGGHDETRLGAEAEGYPGGACSWVIDRVRSWRTYHFQDTSAGAPVKQKGPIDDNEALRPDAANLAAFLYRLRERPPDRDAYRRIVAAVRLVAPFFDDFSLRPDPLSPDRIQLEWTERGSDAYFNAHSLSDGTLRYICLATLLLGPEPPSLVLLDEPELGLHPFAITQLAALLEAAATRTQVVVATQSVTLVDQFGPESIIVVDRRDGQSTFRRLPDDEIASWEDEYSLGELWEKNVLGGRPQRA